MIPPASPVPRSGSAPPYTSTQPPPSHSHLSQNLTGDDNADEDGVSGALTPAFSRSFSLVDTPGTGTNNDFTSLNTLGPEIPTKSPLPSNSPSLSFGGYDGSIWQAPSNDVYQSGTTASTLPSASSGRGEQMDHMVIFHRPRRPTRLLASHHCHLEGQGGQ
jgi:hypothetical protein